MKELAVVILNYNGQSLLERFLPSVIEFSSDAQIYVIDNHSDDDSIEWLTHLFAASVKCIVLDRNYGFAEGYNRGLKHVEEPFWCLLNSDIRVTPNYSNRPLELLKNNPRIGVVQPKILSERQHEHFEYAGAGGGFIDWLGYPYCRGRLFQSIEKDEGQYDDELPVFWATGACLFVTKEVFYLVGQFDPAYFAHQEEIDFCWRARHKNLESWYTSKSHVYHLGGSTLTNSNPFKTYLNFRNSLFTLFKNLPCSELFAILPIRLILDGIAGILFAFQGKPLHTLAVIKAHFGFYFALPSLWKKRKQIYPLQSKRSPISIISEHFVRGREKILK
jgi:GT2 family glycosyltransferase